MFEKASRMKLRFDTPRGQITVEDLWDLPLFRKNANTYTIDDLARSLSRQLKQDAEESFVVKQTSANCKLKLQFDIVKHVIDVSLQEKEAKEKATSKRQEKQRILEILAHKEDQELASKPLDELRKLAKEM